MRLTVSHEVECLLGIRLTEMTGLALAGLLGLFFPEMGIGLNMLNQHFS